MDVQNLGEEEEGRTRYGRRNQEPPEKGLAIHGDSLLVVFDNDKARKKKGDPARFDITPAQDFARVIPKASCNK